MIGTRQNGFLTNWQLNSIWMFVRQKKNWSGFRQNVISALKMMALLSNGGGVVWMNPPYSKPSPWIDKFLQHGNGVALVPMSKSKWFGTLWESSAEIVLLPTAMKFEMPDGDKKQIFMQTILVGVGDIAKESFTKNHFGRIR
jgi:hypothetical protein